MRQLPVHGSLVAVLAVHLHASFVRLRMVQTGMQLQQHPCERAPGARRLEAAQLRDV